MAFIGIRIPARVGRRLSKIDVPGDKTKPDELHITLMYFGKDYPLTEISKSIEAIYQIASKTKPFTVKMEQVSSFPRCEGDKCAVIANVESPELHQFRAKLARRFDKDGIEFSKDFKTFKPHITLSYAEEVPEDFAIRPLEFVVNGVVLWAGEEMDNLLMVAFPLSEKEVEKHAILKAKVGIFEKLAGNPSKS